MKTVKTLLCILTTISLPAYSQNIVVDANTNILDNIKIKPNSRFAFNGGVFKTLPPELKLKNNGQYTLMILDSDDNLTAHELLVTNGQDNKTNVKNEIIIDNKAPSMNYHWKNVIKKGNQIITGPKSQLHWHVDEPRSIVNVMIDNHSVPQISNPLYVTENMSNVTFLATDEFLNESITTVEFSTNFEGSEINWKLNPPSIYINNQWYGKNKAELVVAKQKETNYFVNGKTISNSQSLAEISNNSLLTAEDVLGNKSGENITWIEDSFAPNLVVKTLGETYENPKKMNVKVGQKINIQTQDELLGLLNSEFSINKIDWISLPKTFVFIDTGLFRLNFRSSDTLGNTLSSHIVFKITL